MKEVSLVLPREVFCIDPGIESADYEAYQGIKEMGKSSFLFSQHLVGMKGMGSVYQREKEVQIAGLIVLGSLASVNDSYPWQAQLNPWFLKKMKEGLPTLGICYGHQLIAKLFGGTVSFSRKDESKYVGFRIFHILKNCPLDDIKNSDVEVVASHCEEVKAVPSELEVCASSESVAVEALCHKTLPIVSFQTHPEGRYDFIEERKLSLAGKKDPFKGGKAIMKSFMSYMEQHSKV